MALETKGINLRVIRVIELLFKKVFQILKNIGPVGFMTWGTHPVTNWAVFKFGRFYLLTFFLMTTEANAYLLRSFPQKLFEVRRMRSMTADTLAFGYRLVGKQGSFYLRYLIRIDLIVPVAVVTDDELRGGQKEFIVLGTVGVMAIRAPLLDRLMNKPGLIIEGLLLLMATQTKIWTGPGQTIWRIGSYFTMADHTDACSNRGVSIFDLFHVRMAFF
jgi:hypothetical protein